MKIQNQITTIELNSAELKKVLKDWKKIRFNELGIKGDFDSWKTLPFLDRLMCALETQDQNRGNVWEEDISLPPEN